MSAFLKKRIFDMMRTKKKVLVRNATRDVNSRTSRQIRKGKLKIGKQIGDLITSSAKKHKIDADKKLNSGYISFIDLAYNDSGNCKPSEHRDNCAGQTLFSPGFHHPKDGCGGVSEEVHCVVKDLKENSDCNAHFLNSVVAEENAGSLVQRAEPVTSSSSSSSDLISRPSNSLETIQSQNSHRVSDYMNSCDEDYQELGDLSSEVSAIYIAMQQSMESPSEYVDEEEFEDFDPYLFIKCLPDLSTVVPRFRPLILPKKTRSCPSTTLVLDLDETLVHSTLEPCEDVDFTFPVNFNLQQHTVYVRCRPYLKDFLERVSTLFEIIVFTASQGIYAEQLLNVLDPKRKFFRHRVYRDACVFVEGNYLKDLSVLGRDLSRVIIVDNSPQAFGFQIDNGIPIESWFDDRSDRKLLALLPFLESLVGVEDVRPLIAAKFNLRSKVAVATAAPRLALAI